MIQQFTAEELRTLLEEIIKNAIEAMLPGQEEQLLSPAEACKLFHPSISLPTLARWATEGYVTQHRIGRRVYYKKSEVIESAKAFKPYQRHQAPARKANK